MNIYLKQSVWQENVGDLISLCWTKVKKNIYIKVILVVKQTTVGDCFSNSVGVELEKLKWYLQGFDINLPEHSI